MQWVATLLVRSYRFGTNKKLLDIIVVAISLSLAAFLSYRVAFAFLFISFVVLRFGGLSLTNGGDYTDQPKRPIRNRRNDRRNLSGNSMNLDTPEDQVAIVLDGDTQSSGDTEDLILNDKTEPNQLRLCYSLFDDNKRSDVSLAKLLEDIPRGVLKFYDDINTTHAFHVRGKHYLNDHKKVKAGSPLCKMLMMEVYRLGSRCSDCDVGLSRQDHIVRIGRCRQRFQSFASCSDCPFQLVLNIQIPGDPPLSLVCYFSIPPELFERLALDYGDDHAPVDDTNGAKKEGNHVDGGVLINRNTISTAGLKPSERLLKRFIDIPLTLTELSETKHDEQRHRGSLLGGRTADEVSHSIGTGAATENGFGANLQPEVAVADAMERAVDIPCLLPPTGTPPLESESAFLPCGAGALPALALDTRTDISKRTETAPTVLVDTVKSPTVKTKMPKRSFFSRFGGRSSGKPKLTSPLTTSSVPIRRSLSPFEDSDPDPNPAIVVVASGKDLTNLHVDVLLSTPKREEITAARKGQNGRGKVAAPIRLKKLPTAGTTASSTAEALDLHVSTSQPRGDGRPKKKTTTSKLLSILYSPFKRSRSLESPMTVTVSAPASPKSVHPEPPPENLPESPCSPSYLDAAVSPPNHKLTGRRFHLKNRVNRKTVTVASPPTSNAAAPLPLRLLSCMRPADHDDDDIEPWRDGNSINSRKRTLSILECINREGALPEDVDVEPKMGRVSDDDPHMTNMVQEFEPTTDAAAVLTPSSLRLHPHVQSESEATSDIPKPTGADFAATAASAFTSISHDPSGGTEREPEPAGGGGDDEQATEENLRVSGGATVSGSSAASDSAANYSERGSGRDDEDLAINGCLPSTSVSLKTSVWCSVPSSASSEAEMEIAGELRTQQQVVALASFRALTDDNTRAEIAASHRATLALSNPTFSPDERTAFPIGLPSITAEDRDELSVKHLLHSKDTQHHREDVALLLRPASVVEEASVPSEHHSNGNTSVHGVRQDHSAAVRPSPTAKPPPPSPLSVKTVPGISTSTVGPPPDTSPSLSKRSYWSFPSLLSSSKSKALAAAASAPAMPGPDDATASRPFPESEGSRGVASTDPGVLPSDDFRNRRMKLIPCVVEGPWVVRMSVRSTPVLLGQKLTQRYFRGENYFEIDVDIGSEAIASRIVSVCRNYAKNVVVNLGLVIQGEDESELPEELLACISLKHIDLTQSIPLVDAVDPLQEESQGKVNESELEKEEAERSDVSCRGTYAD